MGGIPSLWTRYEYVYFNIQKVEWNICSAEKRKKIHFQWERDSPCTYCYTPLPLHTFLWKISDLVYDVFYPISKKSRQYKIYQASHIFLFFLCPPQKKSRSYGTDIQLISVIDFTALTSFWSVFPPKALVLHRGRVSNFVYQKL